MATKKDIIANELMKEIISIRIDTLWKMLAQKKAGFLPGTDEEGATGKFDNKGAMFIPGGLIYQDVDEKVIDYEPYDTIENDEFRKSIRSAMQYDNATLLYADGIAAGVNLDSGFFSRAARNIYTFKKAAFRRRSRIGRDREIEINSADIIRSHCPTYVKPPYGARTRISACISIGLVDPPMFFAYCKTELNLTEAESIEFGESLDRAKEKVVSRSGAVMCSPHVVVCHDTRYSSNSFTGLTRILGIGKFGEFATFSLERVSGNLLAEFQRKKHQLNPEDIVADYDGIKIVPILRVYAPTNPGKRSQKYSLHVVSPSRELDLDVGQIEKEARDRYQIS